MHNLDNFFTQLANAVVNVWKARSACAKPSLFGDPAQERRSRFWLTVAAVIVTLFAIAIAVGIFYGIWWAFTIHERAG